MKDEKNLENQLNEKNLNAPRLTPNLIDNKIKETSYFVHKNILTICVLELENGYFVTGESACASPENFDKKIGEEIAFENARKKIWGLEGYRLKEELYRG